VDAASASAADDAWLFEVERDTCGSAGQEAAGGKGGEGEG